MLLPPQVGHCLGFEGRDRGADGCSAPSRESAAQGNEEARSPVSTNRAGGRDLSREGANWGTSLGTTADRQPGVLIVPRRQLGQ